jgi:hypothetical protein
MPALIGLEGLVPAPCLDKLRWWGGWVGCAGAGGSSLGEGVWIILWGRGSIVCVFVISL